MPLVKSEVKIQILEPDGTTTPVTISELRAGGPVVAHGDVPGHGKLLVDAAMPGYPFRGFASNTREPAVYELLLPSGFGDAVSAIENVYNFSAYADFPLADLHCPSTHGLAYSKLNGHVYATCSDVGALARPRRVS